MNTERRHELETNTLAKGLNDWSEKLRPYTSVILGVIAALLLIYVAATMWNSYQQRRGQAAWDAYQSAVFEGDAELSALQRLANGEEFAGTDVQEWALLGWADRQLLLAARTYLIDREAAKEKLTNVVEVYQQFAESGSTPELRNRARLGLARVNEMQGDIDEAMKNYQQVAGALGDIAKLRIDTLKSPQAEATINWLATVDLPKVTPPTGAGAPGDRPGFEAATPATDPLAAPGETTSGAESLEDILSGLRSSGAAPAAADGAATTSPSATTPPATSDQPATEPTAGPATEPGAGEPPAGEAEAGAPAAAAEQPAAPAEPASEPPAVPSPAAGDSPEPAEGTEPASPPEEDAAENATPASQ